MKKNNKYGVVIVLYNFDYDVVLKNINELNSSMIEQIILVDNSFVNKSYLFEGISDKINYIWLEGNKGIAFAQNIAIKKFIELSLDFIFFFDQDSLIPKNYTDKMIQFSKPFEADQIAIFAPKIVSYDEFQDCIFLEPSEVNEVISSGSLIKTSVFEEIGFMDEILFIDYVDFEFCWRAKKAGYKILQSQSICLPHKVGNQTITFLGKNIYIPAPFRYFYIYRNGNILMHRNYVPLYWKKRERVLRILTPIFVLFLFDKKIERFRYIWSGIKDD